MKHMNQILTLKKTLEKKIARFNR